MDTMNPDFVASRFYDILVRDIMVIYMYNIYHIYIYMWLSETFRWSYSHARSDAFESPVATFKKKINLSLATPHAEFQRLFS